MTRCFPPNPEFGRGRHGERAVWEALSAHLPDEAAILYSRWIVEEAREHEIDVLVAWLGIGSRRSRSRAVMSSATRGTAGGATGDTTGARSRTR